MKRKLAQTMPYEMPLPTKHGPGQKVVRIDAPLAVSEGSRGASGMTEPTKPVSGSSIINESLHQSANALIMTVKEYYDESVHELVVTDNMTSILSVLYALPGEQRSIEMSDGMWLIPCPGYFDNCSESKCARANICRYFKNESYCSECTKRRKCSRKREKSRVKNGSARVKPNSHANWTKQSPSSVAKRAANLRKENRALKASLK